MRQTPGTVTPGGGDGAKTAESGDGSKPPEDPSAVRAAQDALVRESVIPFLLDALKDPSFEVRTAAAVALGKAGDPAALEPLRKSFQTDEHNDVRDAAILGVGLLGKEEAVPYLEMVLADDRLSTRHRSFAAFSLGLIGGKRAAKVLVDAVTLDDGLRHREDSPYLASIFLGMGFCGDASVLPTLRRAAKDRGYDEQVRAFIWLALGRAKDKDSVPLFVEALAQPQERIALQRAAAVALGRAGDAKDTSATGALFDAMKGSKDPLVRHYAAVSLGGFADDRLRAELRKHFAKCETGDRPFTALALGVAQDDEAAPLLRQALAEERNENVQGAYAIALGMLSDFAARSVLEEQVKNRGRIWAQGYCALAIGMARITDSAPVLRKELEATRDPRLRANLAVGLGLLHDAKAREWFFETLRSDGTLYERGGAAMALGLLRINEAVPLLVAVWRDKKEKDLMRAYAVVALGILADPSDPPKLARFSIDSDYSLSNDPLNEVMTIY
jgi:HEAT repeat protein